jgi:hypothetical protein
MLKKVRMHTPQCVPSTKSLRKDLLRLIKGVMYWLLKDTKGMGVK